MLPFNAFVLGLIVYSTKMAGVSPLVSEDVSTTFERFKNAVIGPSIESVIAELSNVQLDEIGKKTERDPLFYMEPVVGSWIILNGICIGVQTNERIQNWDGWYAVEYIFAVLFTGEAILKTYLSPKDYFCGGDKRWNYFDAVIVLLAWVNIIAEETSDGEALSGLTILRLARLTRLARLVRIFRLKQFAELTLMIKGLFSGMATLFWAIVLLFFIIYVLGIFMTELVAVKSVDYSEEVFDEDVIPLFRSLEMSMATLFRCFTGDCSSKAGRPLIPTLEDTFGALFGLGWVGCTMLVMFGVFNLIMALYIESTMMAAKAQQETTQQYKRELVRVADYTRELMLRFYLAQRKANDGHVPKDMPKEILDVSIDISKDTFLNVIQDPKSRQFMDDLEIPSERARLFDVFDADASGSLDVKELVRGLLRVRGETQRSDIVAGYLGVRALLELVRQLEQKVQVGNAKIDMRFDQVEVLVANLQKLDL